MKKKVILLSLALMLLLTGVVSAATLWGKYKGHSIMRITVDGTPVKTDVPAFVFDNRTMVPVYLLKEAGIEYSLDGKNQTVDIKKSDSFVNEEEFIEMNKLMQTNRAFIYFMDQVDLVSATIDVVNASSTQAQYDQAMDLVDKINIVGLDDWLFLLNGISAPDAYSFEQIINIVERAKNYLYEGDSKNAFTQFISARSSMNILNTTIDSRFNGIFGVKNIERLSK